MPATRSVTTEFTWSEGQQRYRRAGRFVSDRAVKLGVRRVMRKAAVEIKSLTSDMTAGRVTVSDWQTRMSSELKNLHVASAIAGRGGLNQMQRVDYLRVGRELKFQYAKLRNFAAEIEAKSVTRKDVHRRTKLYVAAMEHTFQASRRAGAISAGFDQERNILSNIPHERHCTANEKRTGCVDQTAAGWVAIGSLVPTGKRACFANCQCAYAFRRHSQISKLMGTLPQ